MASVMNARDGYPFYQRHSMLGEQLRGVSVPDRSEFVRTPQAARNILGDFLDYEHRRRFVGEYMTKVDGAAMYYALEARSPLLDQEIWNFAATLPYDMRLRGGHLKAILRELARRHLGDRVATGRKRGFGIPVQRWLAGKWKPVVEETFRTSMLASEGWIRSDALIRELNVAAANGMATNHLWYCYVLETWFREQHRAATTVCV
jgi:asparagine synthase (glutamine-hydrolysing)